MDVPAPGTASNPAGSPNDDPTIGTAPGTASNPAGSPNDAPTTGTALNTTPTSIASDPFLPSGSSPVSYVDVFVDNFIGIC